MFDYFMMMFVCCSLHILWAVDHAELPELRAIRSEVILVVDAVQQVVQADRPQVTGVCLIGR